LPDIVLLPTKIDSTGVSKLVGSYAADPNIRQICAEAYEKRDAETGKGSP
jgi:hypothetical protein